MWHLTINQKICRVMIIGRAALDPPFDERERKKTENIVIATPSCEDEGEMEVINRRTEGEMDLAVSICVCVLFETHCSGAVFVFSVIVRTEQCTKVREAIRPLDTF